MNAIDLFVLVLLEEDSVLNDRPCVSLKSAIEWMRSSAETLLQQNYERWTVENLSRAL